MAGEGGNADTIKVARSTDRAGCSDWIPVPPLPACSLNNLEIGLAAQYDRECRFTSNNAALLSAPSRSRLASERMKGTVQHQNPCGLDTHGGAGTQPPSNADPTCVVGCTVLGTCFT